MLTTSTHDTKRGEDAAARIAVLSEVPKVWATFVHRWQEILGWDRAPNTAARVPEPALLYGFFQALVGAWPFGWNGEDGRDAFVERLRGFALKSSREAKLKTSWLNPNRDYETALEAFIDACAENDAFWASAHELCTLIEPAAASNALAQCLLRFSAPGVPDTYQGSELWQQSLVDPDNRRPVDFELRRTLLEGIRSRLTERSALAKELSSRYQDGAIKLYVTHVALQTRKRLPELFLRGDYEALEGGEHVVAFTRGFGDERLICVVPRLVHGLVEGHGGLAVGAVWGEQQLEVRHAGTYRNVLTDAVIHVTERVKLSELLSDLSVALLIKEAEA